MSSYYFYLQINLSHHHITYHLPTQKSFISTLILIIMPLISWHYSQLSISIFYCSWWVSPSQVTAFQHGRLLGWLLCFCQLPKIRPSLKAYFSGPKTFLVLTPSRPLLLKLPATPRNNNIIKFLINNLLVFIVLFHCLLSALPHQLHYKLGGTGICLSVSLILPTTW